MHTFVGICGYDVDQIYTHGILCFVIRKSNNYWCNRKYIYDKMC